MADEPETETKVASAAKGVDAPSVSDAEVLVQSWFNIYVANSPVSQSAEAVNHMTQVAIPALVKLLSTKG